MGGQHQATAPAKVSGTIGQVRFHLADDGNVHFHDDKSGHKVTVPAAKWWKSWDEYQLTNKGRIEFTDNTTGCRLRIKHGKNDTKIRIDQIKRPTGQTTQSLSEFTTKIKT